MAPSQGRIQVWGGLREASDAEPIIKGSGLPEKHPNFQEMLRLINECTFLEKSATTDNATSPLEDVLSTWSLWNGRSHCDCDKEFYSCLKTSGNKIADVVGNLDFNIMKIQCIKEHRPFVCVQNRTDIDGTEKCVQWGADPDSKKMQTSVTLLKY